MTCEENSGQSETVGYDLHVNVRDGTLLFKIGSNLGMYNKARVYV